MPVPVPDFIGEELARSMATEKPYPSEYLLYPQRRTGRSDRSNRDVEGVIWEDRTKPLSATAMHRLMEPLA
jgi:hypothetical protein